MPLQQTNSAPPAATEQARPAEFDGEAWLDQQLAKIDRVRGTINLTADGVEFGDFAGVQRYARMMIEAGCVPIDDKRDRDPKTGDWLHDKILARTTLQIMLGRRVGLPPEEAVASTYVVNNRATIFGDAPLAIARQHPGWVEAGYKEYFEVVADGKYERVKGNPTPEQFKSPTTRCVVETLRKGATEPKVHTYSMGDAVAAGVTNNALYAKNPHRMLRFRARGHNLRDNFGDALKGLGIREVDDTEAEAEGPKAAPTLPTGTLDLRTLNVSPPTPPTPPAAVPPTVLPASPPPPVTPQGRKRAASLPPPPAPTLVADPVTSAIEEITLLDPAAFAKFLIARGLVPEDIEDSKGEVRENWAAELQGEVRRLTLAQES